MQKIISLIKLIRLHNCIMAGIGVWLGGYLVGADIGGIKIFFASLAAVLVCGGGNALNDYLDIESDKINHPKRPLPGGKLPPSMAILITLVFNIAAIVSAAMVNIVVLIIVLISVLLLVIYNFKLKNLPMIGNLAISLLGGMTFIVGGLTVDSFSIFVLPRVMVPALFACLFHLGRELLKDIADFEGDVVTECQTMASVVSRQSVMMIISIIYIVLILLTLIPIVLSWYSPIYGYIAVGLVDIPVIFVLIYLWLGRSTRRFTVGGTILKLLMLFGLFAFYFGKI